jgi:hypothetical protein
MGIDLEQTEGQVGLHHDLLPSRSGPSLRPIPVRDGTADPERETVINPRVFDLHWAATPPNQNREEWFRWISLLKSILDERGITCPVIVEIGVHTQCQRYFYEGMLTGGARWIGIDLSDEYSKPTIKGDSSDPETLKMLGSLLDARGIDVLFIDGDHSYEAVKRDYEIYAPLARHIVAFHDIRSIAGPGRLFEEIIDGSNSDRKTTFLRVECWNTHTYRYGIGVIIKGE